MIEARDFIEPARAAGFSIWSGVPCSFLTPFINSIIDDPELDYIGAANEGDAVAIASGAALAGRRSVVMMQNSGLGNAVSPLSSLNWVFRIPVLLIVTLRGEPGLPDEPQHELMGQITTRILDELQIPWAYFPRTALDVEGALTVASWQMDKTGLPYALVMRKGSVQTTEFRDRRSAVQPRAGRFADRSEAQDPVLTRRQVLEIVQAHSPLDQSLVVASTGYTGRELYALEDRDNQFYMVGSMGCASALGLGLSRCLPERRIFVADGDGAVLMRMGNLATIGAYGGDNFHHVLLDNGVHESTGGQSTVSAAISFAAVASACGYREMDEVTSEKQVTAMLQISRGPVMQHVRIRQAVVTDLPRPELSPPQVKQRFMAALGATAPWAGL